MNVSNLTIDECQLIAAKLELDPRSLGMFAMTCKLARESVELVQKGCKLDSLPRHMNQGELCSALQLTPDEAKRLPYHEEHRVAMGFHNVTHCFDLHTALPRLIARIGWSGLSARIAQRREKKRKRDDLDERREAAVSKRIRALDEWFATEMPFGPDVDSTNAWLDSVKARNSHIGRCDAKYKGTIESYTQPLKLTGPTIFQVKEAVLDLEERVARQWAIDEQKRIKKEAELRLETEASQRAKQEVKEALERREYSWDDRLATVSRLDAAKWRVPGPTNGFGAIRSSDTDSMVSEIVLEIEDMRRRAEEKKAVVERRTQLQKEMRKLKLKIASEKATYDSFVNNGVTKGGSKTAADAANEMKAVSDRRAELVDECQRAGLQVEDVSLATKYAFEQSGTLNNQPTTAKEVVQCTLQMLEAKRLVKERAQQIRSRPPDVEPRHWHSFWRIFHKHRKIWCESGKWMDKDDASIEHVFHFIRKNIAERMTSGAASSSAASRSPSLKSLCNSAPIGGPRKCTQPGCPNQHRQHDPAIGPNGPVCGRCAHLPR